VTASLIADVVALSVQITCVVAIAALVSLVVRIDAAAVRYQYWRAVLVLCLLLPWIQGRQATTVAGDGIGTAVFSVSTIATIPAPDDQVERAGVSWPAIGAWIVVGVIALRLAWLGLSLMRLRRLRRSGRLAEPNAEHDHLQWALGTRAEIRYVPGAQPVTCGAWRPVVLLPETLRAHSLAIQRAVLTHELLHVQRRDWLWAMGEEAIRAVLWFHPAIWWLVGRVRLAREEVVDELTVLATGQRRTYLEALLVFADAPPAIPVAAFARRHHLFRRMMLISKEAVMSSKRIVFSSLVLALAVMAGSWYAVAAFPMTEPLPQISDDRRELQAPADMRDRAAAAVAAVQRAARRVPSARQTAATGAIGPLEQAAKPITPENPIPRRTYSVTPQNPGGPDAGVVVLTVRVTVNGLGRVAEVRSLSGVIGGRVGATGPADRGRGRAAAAGQGGVVPPSEEFTRAAIAAVRQWIYDPPADPPISFDVTLAFTPGSETRLLAHGGPVGAPGFRIGGPAGAPPLPPPPPPPPPPGSATSFNWTNGAVRVGGNIKMPTKTKDVAPVYPPIAQSARVQGVVILETLIGADGRVEDARVLRSIPLLDQAALDAVKQWEFTPTLLNGTPVPVIMTTTVQFSLSQ
jgi:protein TonB